MNDNDLELRLVNVRLPLIAGMLFLIVGCSQDAPQQVVPIESPDANAASESDAPDGDDLNEQARIPAAAEPLGLLVSAELLQKHLDDSSVRILDVRSQAEFDVGHIPGAVPVDVSVWKSLT